MTATDLNELISKIDTHVSTGGDIGDMTKQFLKNTKTSLKALVATNERFREIAV